MSNFELLMAKILESLICNLEFFTLELVCLMFIYFSFTTPNLYLFFRIRLRWWVTNWEAVQKIGKETEKNVQRSGTRNEIKYRTNWNNLTSYRFRIFYIFWGNSSFNSDIIFPAYIEIEFLNYFRLLLLRDEKISSQNAMYLPLLSLSHIFLVYYPQGGEKIRNFFQEC